MALSKRNVSQTLFWSSFHTKTKTASQQLLAVIQVMPHGNKMTDYYIVPYVNVAVGSPQ